MNIFKRIGKEIGKITKNAAPLLIEATNLGIPSAVKFVASSLGVSGAGPEVLLKRLQDKDLDPQVLIEIEKNKFKELELLVEDRKSARNLGTELSKSQSVLNRNIVPILALVAIFGHMAFIFAMFTKGLVTTENKDLVMMTFASVSHISGQVIGYFFGSTEKNERQKPEDFINL